MTRRRKSLSCIFKRRSYNTSTSTIVIVAVAIKLSADSGPGPHRFQQQPLTALVKTCQLAAGKSQRDAEELCTKSQQTTSSISCCKYLDIRWCHRREMFEHRDIFRQLIDRNAAVISGKKCRPLVGSKTVLDQFQTDGEIFKGFGLQKINVRVVGRISSNLFLSNS